MMLLFIREPISLPILAVITLLLSKWRMFAVKPRFWPANIRSNMIDIIVGLSVIVFLSGTDNLITQFIWVGFYIIWLLVLKPRSNPGSVAIQAIIGQTLGLVALQGSYSESSLLILVTLTWVISYSAARHFFSAFDEDHTNLYAHVWGLFSAELAWVLAHWQLSYSFMPQIALVLTLVGYSIAFCYYLHATRGLKAGVRNQFIIITVLSLALIALFSEWQYKGI